MSGEHRRRRTTLDPLAAGSGPLWPASVLDSDARARPFTARAGPHRELGDPLDAVANLFEAGVVLALGFLLWGLVLGSRNSANERASRPLNTATSATPIIPTHGRAQGRGVPVGRVYRLSDGRLVLVRESSGAARAGGAAER
ncbi:DUF2149 domain-containing protein [Thermoleophilum album]|uniref:DUF2149 domain-containing protein n=1 Tax=Thermoleophilum album TaxID=29539 RepID=UPI00237CD654|nr:DUF2149 domain-containing protein [Thermoleophilum album]WDT93745.1 DUF2149 domain-containing protein [Thermoleophilum album]